MDFLRCNKCYRLLSDSRKKFIMTQCGHIFCERCLTPAITQCPECGTIEFSTITLAKPPKLETMINYFSPTSDFIQLSLKAIKFHDEQLGIIMRGFQEFKFDMKSWNRQFQVPKYKDFKVLHAKMMKDVKAQSNGYKKLQMDSEQQKMEMKKKLNELSIQRSRDNEYAMEIDYSSDQENSQRFGNSQRTLYPLQSSQKVPVKFSSMPKYPESPQVQRRISPSDRLKKLVQSTPTYRYNPSPAFSTNSFPTSNSSPDSGTGTLIGSPALRQGEFLVPNIQKVPKSVASLEKIKLAVQARQPSYKCGNGS